VRKHWDEFRRYGVQVLVITQSKPEAVASPVLDLPTLCDPDRTAYRYFGLERGRWRIFLRFGVLARYLRLMMRGWWPWGWERGEDLLQLGGDFIVSAELQLLYAYRSADPTDRPTATELVNVIQRLQL
jgi:alkyl-hydroperoxide reductase/thiol specific antioxidant family protein